MSRVQGASLIACAIAIQFVAPRYRVGVWALYDLAIIGMWGLMLLWPVPLQRIRLGLILRTTLVLGAVVAAGGIATLYSANVIGTAPVFRDLVRALGGVALYAGAGILAYAHYERLDWVAWAFTVVAGFQGLLALANIGEISRYAGTFTDPNYFATFEAVVFVILLAKATDSAYARTLQAFYRIGLYLLCVLTALTILVSFSRGAYLSVIVGSGVVLLARLRRSPGRVIFPVIVAFAALGVGSQFFFNLPSFAKWSERLSLSNMLATGGAGRVDIWRDALHAFLSNPIGFGWGTESEVMGMVGHNLFVETGIQFGFLGLILVLVFWILSARDILVLFRHHRSAVELGFAGATAVMLVSSLTLSSLLSRPFWFVLSLAGVAANRVSVPEQIELNPPGWGFGAK